jgi:hypothetical protein
MDQSRPPDRTRTAPTKEATRTAPAPPAAARPNVQPTPAQPVVQGPPPENLTIVPVVSGPQPTSLSFDWEAVTMGTNRSYACAVGVRDDAALSVTMTQGPYRRSYSGAGIVKTGPVPPAPAGTEGSLTVRDASSGESVTCVWRWQAKSSATAAAGPAPSRGGLLSKLFGRAKTETRPGVARKVPSLTERLGSRAAHAVTLKFFGQEATGQRFAFILDQSGSMHGSRWKACTAQLARALKVMPSHAEFVVVLFASALTEPPQQTDWLKAHPADIEGVLAWLSTQHPWGGTYVTPAFQRAFSFSTPPDVIYFLTDGDVSDFPAETCERVRGTALTIINTICLENAEGREALTAIAEQTGGTFILIPKAEEGGAR